MGKIGGHLKSLTRFAKNENTKNFCSTEINNSLIFDGPTHDLQSSEIKIGSHHSLWKWGYLKEF